MSVSIKLVNLVTGYHTRKGRKVIGESLNAEVDQGQLICLLGPNGAGKSTLLKTLSGFIPPLDGTIAIEGRNLTEYSDTELSRMVGVVLTDRVHMSNMSVTELVGMGRSPYTGFWGRLSDVDRNVVDESMAMVGITDLRGRMVDTLSDGERQKAMIAKALAQHTPVIFLDEPTAFLDYPSKVDIMKLLHRISHNESKTVFLSTHDLELALQIADGIWLIDKEKGLVTGTPEDLALSGDLASYFERPGIRFDVETGMFRVIDGVLHSVRVQGEGVRASMIKKALMRNGISADCDSCGSPLILVGDDAFYVDGMRFELISDVIRKVNSLFSSI